MPTATVTHLGGQSTQQVAIEMFLQLYRSKILYFRKHFGSLAANAYKIILMFAGILRLLISPLAFLERQPIRRQRWAQVGNYLRLLFVLPNM